VGRRDSLKHSVLEPLPAEFYAKTRRKLRARADDDGLDGLLLLSPGNITYATGWHFSRNERPIGLWLGTNGDSVLLVPHLDYEYASEVPGLKVRAYQEFPGVTPPVLWMLDETGARRVAIDTLDAALLGAAQQKLERLDLEDHAREERSVKSDAELALTREAARFADQVLKRLLANGGDIIAQGGTEVDLLTDCTGHVRESLSDVHGEKFQGTKVAITASVHSGPRAALPHGSVISRKPKPREPIIAGIGCCIGGYHAESGATFVLGEISKEQSLLMSAMTQAGTATVEALQNGTRCDQVNEIALEKIREAGFGSAIRHRIGHGMGIEGHEAPWLAPGDHTRTLPGMVFSCEPGIYRPGLDGWRTIDTLIVGKDQVELASTFLKDHPAHNRVLTF